MLLLVAIPRLAFAEPKVALAPLDDDDGKIAEIVGDVVSERAKLTKPGRVQGAMRSMGGPMVVQQTADTLTVERIAGESKIVSTYKLNGAESVNKRTMGQMGEVEIKSKAKFDGAKLTITSLQPGRDGAPIEMTETWSLEGGNLVIESTNPRGTQKRVYKKNT